MKKLRTLSALLALITLLTLALPMLGATAATGTGTINKTVNLANASKNARGDGFEWANLTNTLTLDNLNINTADEFGMKIPKDATVILKGNNYIPAATVGLVCTGQVTFEGSGTLTVVAGDVGIDMTGVYDTHLARFRSGTVKITAGKTAIRSGAAELNFMGSKLTLNVSADNTAARAVDGRTVNISGGEITANAGIYASNALNVTSVNAYVTSNSGSALNCPNTIRMTKVSILAGKTGEALLKTDSYNGEGSVKLTSTASNKKTSILFGDKLPKALDYVAFAILIIGVAALIAVPVYLKKKKTEKLIAEYEATQSGKKTKASSTKPTGKK